MLVETLMQWEAYLNLAQMELKHVQRLKRKHRFIMFLLKKVGNRTAGMGWKIMKFHAILHLAYDILMFGVPMTVAPQDDKSCGQVDTEGHQNLRETDVPPHG